MAKKEIIKSKSMSFEGWTFKEFFKGNWKSIKEIIKVLIPLAIGWSTTNNPALTGLITVLGKSILDIGQYYFNEYKQ